MPHVYCDLSRFLFVLPVFSLCSLCVLCVFSVLSRYPFQLGHHSVADHPSTAQMFDAVLEEGDLVVMGSDGVFDNLTDSEILAEAFRHVSLHQEEQEDQEGISRQQQPSAIARQNVLQIANAIVREVRLKAQELQ